MSAKIVMKLILKTRKTLLTMADLQQLKSLTLEFFKRHWYSREECDFPSWSWEWKFEGEVPDNTYTGCYAWIKNEKIVYVGLAINKGVKGYEGHALGTRIAKYWRVNKVSHYRGTYRPADNYKDKLDSIVTLAFKKKDKNGNSDQDYLAVALELYLIRAIQPEYNTRGK